MGLPLLSKYVLASLGITIQVVSGWWDVYSHRIHFTEVDPWWNSAHFAMYAGALMVLVAAYPWFKRRALSAEIFGMNIISAGAVTQILAGVWNEVVHRFEPSEPPLSPPHVLLTVGMIVVNLGVLIGVSLEYGLVKEGVTPARPSTKLLLAAMLIMTFAAMWLVSAGSIIYLARVFRTDETRLVIAALLAANMPLILAPALRVFGKPGPGLAIGAAYTVINYYFLVFYVGLPAYAPYGLITPAVFEAVYYATRRLGTFTASLLSGAVSGLFLSFTYFPFTPYLLNVDWPPLNQKFLLFVTAALLGGVLGHILVDLTGAILEKRYKPAASNLLDSI